MPSASSGSRVRDQVGGAGSGRVAVRQVGGELGRSRAAAATATAAVLVWLCMLTAPGNVYLLAQISAYNPTTHS